MGRSWSETYCYPDEKCNSWWIYLSLLPLLKNSEPTTKLCPLTFHSLHSVWCFWVLPQSQWPWLNSYSFNQQLCPHRQLQPAASSTLMTQEFQTWNRLGFSCFFSILPQRTTSVASKELCFPTQLGYGFLYFICFEISYSHMNCI